MQINENSIPSSQVNANIDLELIILVKKLILDYKKSSTDDCVYRDIFNYWNNGMYSYYDLGDNSNKVPLSFYNKDHLKSAILQLEGIDRFERRKSSFRNVQRFQNHTGCSSLNYVSLNQSQTKNNVGTENHGSIIYTHLH